MKVLLISSPSESLFFPRSIWNTQNLGLLSIISNLDARHEARLLDFFDRKTHYMDRILNEINDFKPDIIGISSMTFQYKNTVLIASSLKKKYPWIKIVLGGYHATVMYKEIYESNDKFYFDFIVRNEGEIVFNQLLYALSDNEKKFDNIKGLSYFDGEKVFHNEKSSLLDLSKIKLPDRNISNYNNYKFYNPIISKYKTIAFIETSRGCYNNCNFCSITKMYGKTFRTYDLDRVIEDLKQVKEKKVEAVLFVDDNILLDTDRFEKLCDMIIENNLNKIDYIVQCSSKGIAKSEKLVYKMRKAGFNIVFLGIENNSKENLKFFKKGDISNLTNTAVKYLHKHNLFIAGGLIIGLPDDNKKTIKTIFKFASRLNIDHLAVQIVTPYPKTGIREMYTDMDLITNLENYEKYDGYWANVKTKYLSSFELMYFRQIEYIKYLTIKRKLNLKNLIHRPFDFLLHLLINPFLFLYFYIIKIKLNINVESAIRKLFDKCEYDQQSYFNNPDSDFLKN